MTTESVLMAPGDGWRRERAYGRVPAEVGKAEREKLLMVLDGFLDAELAKKAGELRPAPVLITTKTRGVSLNSIFRPRFSRIL